MTMAIELWCDLEDAVVEGIDDHVTKPIRVDALVEALHNAGRQGK